MSDNTEIPFEAPVDEFHDTFVETLQRMLPQVLEIIAKTNRKDPSTLVLQGLTEFIADTIVLSRGASSEDAERFRGQIVALRKMRDDFEDLVFHF